MNPLVKATATPRSKRQLREFADRFGVTIKRMKKVFRKQARGAEVWLNELYIVHKIVHDDGWTELSIRRQDRDHVTDWRHKQAIKNQLCGAECEGLELYPAESRLYDTANQYYLWIRTEPGDRIPVGMDAGRHVSNEPIGGSVQRPFDEENTT